MKWFDQLDRLQCPPHPPGPFVVLDRRYIPPQRLGTRRLRVDALLGQLGRQVPGRPRLHTIEPLDPRHQGNLFASRNLDRQDRRIRGGNRKQYEPGHWDPATGLDDFQLVDHPSAFQRQGHQQRIVRFENCSPRVNSFDQETPGPSRTRGQVIVQPLQTLGITPLEPLATDGHHDITAGRLAQHCPQQIRAPGRRQPVHTSL